MGNNQGTAITDADFEIFEDQESILQLLPLILDIVGEDFHETPQPQSTSALTGAMYLVTCHLKLFQFSASEMVLWNENTRMRGSENENHFPKVGDKRILRGYSPLVQNVSKRKEKPSITRGKKLKNLKVHQHIANKLITQHVD